MKKIIYSGMQSTSIPQLGNLLGAIVHWNKLQEEYTCLYSVVDMHSITVRQDPKEFKQRTRELIAWYLAIGLNPDKNILYVQSHVPAHAELAWILNCFTYIGELNRMTQFKDKSKKNADNINAGLFAYPVLMAADILLYKTDAVPVGDDQRQHLELTRDIAQRFNNIYGEVFTIPEPFIAQVGARIMSLQSPTEKMSKSDENENATIFLSDNPDTIIKKFKRAVTDSDNKIYISDDKPGVSNLLTIYSCVRNIKINDAVAEFEGKGYGQLKQSVGEAVVEMIKPYKKEFDNIINDPVFLDNIMLEGAKKANKMAEATLKNVKEVIGFNIGGVL